MPWHCALGVVDAAVGETFKPTPPNLKTIASPSKTCCSLLAQPGGDDSFCSEPWLSSVSPASCAVARSWVQFGHWQSDGSSFCGLQRPSPWPRQILLHQAVHSSTLWNEENRSGSCDLVTSREVSSLCVLGRAVQRFGVSRGDEFGMFRRNLQRKPPSPPSRMRNVSPAAFSRPLQERTWTLYL